ncbi:hypothetical protein GCM10023114_15340 [Mycolicibacterium sediminis]
MFQGRGFVLKPDGQLGHGGTIPDSTTVVVYLPDAGATLVALANSDVPAKRAAARSRRPSPR